jgi:hypothetical protein
MTRSSRPRNATTPAEPPVSEAAATDSDCDAEVPAAGEQSESIQTYLHPRAANPDCRSGAACPMGQTGSTAIGPAAIRRPGRPGRPGRPAGDGAGCAGAADPATAPTTCAAPDHQA